MAVAKLEATPPTPPMSAGINCRPATVLQTPAVTM
jgi:hypothetical protein